MKTGEIFTDPRQRWFEPDHFILGSRSYFLHAWGPAYALSSRTVATIASLPRGALRHFANEDVTVGAWMLALDALHR